MKMFTRHVSSQLAAYLDGELGSREARRLETHLERCQRCRRERELVRSGLAMLDSLPPVPAPDSIWLAIEAALPEVRSPEWQFRRRWRLALAMLAVLTVTGIAYWSRYRPGTSWELMRIQGTPVVGATPVRDVVRIVAGEWIETDSFASATMKIGLIGSVEIAPHTRLLVVTARPDRNRLVLTRGKIHAKISAPPKLFFVDTASGTAIDQGCEYSLRTDEQGLGLLEVTQGWVSFEWKGVESLVPAGASCRTDPQAGPGAPYFDDASANFKQALESFASAKYEGASLDPILAESRARDTLTLWHLLSRVKFRDRERIYSRMATLTPVPAGISRQKALNLNPETLTRWMNELAWTW